MKTYPILLLLVLLSTLLFAQRVESVDWDLDATQENILITYNLVKEGTSSNQFFQVSVRATLNDKPLSITAVTGDVGGYVKAGMAKRIVWAWHNDVAEIEGNLKFIIVAVDPLQSNPQSVKPVDPNANQPTGPSAPRPVPPWAGITGSGGLAVSGLGLGIAGLSQISNGKELYSVYESNPDPSAMVYTELTRDELYQEANAKYKRGQYLGYGGAAILAAGAYLMVSRIVGYNQLKKKAGITAAPAFHIAPVNAAYSGPAHGFQLLYRF